MLLMVATVPKGSFSFGPLLMVGALTYQFSKSLYISLNPLELVSDSERKAAQEYKSFAIWRPISIDLFTLPRRSDPENSETPKLRSLDVLYTMRSLRWVIIIRNPAHPQFHRMHYTAE